MPNDVNLEETESLLLFLELVPQIEDLHFDLP
jgi:hypothetical protein